MKRYIAVANVRRPYGNSLKLQVFDVIVAAGETGANRREIADTTNLNVGRVSSYLAELKREGLILRSGDPVDMTRMSPEEATLYAMSAMENALVANAQKNGITPAMTKAFARYQKIKALALGATTDGEERAALRRTLLDLVQLVF